MATNLLHAQHINEQQQLQYLNAINGATQSDLTCIPPLSRKRSRDASLPESLPLPSTTACGCLADSTATSTSGRAFASSPSPLTQHLYNQNIEIDTIVRLQTQRMQSEFQEARKRHCRDLLSMLEQQTAKRLKEKEIQLEAACRRNAELEEKIRLVAGEREVWMSIARNNEAVVGSLRSALEQMVVQSIAGAGDDCVPVFPAEDVESCCYEPDTGDGYRTAAAASASRRACRVCGGGNVSVLVLPCRHLCLCKDCESGVDTCPVCLSAKNASLQVFMV